MYVYILIFLGLLKVTLSSSDLPGDWLVESIGIEPTVVNGKSGQDISISNGLLTRRFSIVPNFGTIDFVLEASNAVGQGGYRNHVLRSFGPEAYITLDKNYTYAVGGVEIENQKHRAYVNVTCLNQGLSNSNSSFQYVSHTVSKPVAPVPWTPGFRHSPKLPWPPVGIHLEVIFRPPSSAPSIHKDVSVSVHYELYQGIPLLSKWLTVKNNNNTTKVTLSSVVVETLSVNREFAPLGNSYGGPPLDSSSPQGNLHVEANIPHGVDITWNTDVLDTIATDAGATEPQLNVSYATGPGVHLHGDVVFESFRAMMMLLGAHDDVQRKSLSRLQIVRRLAPWTSENPIFFHSMEVSSDAMRQVIDQMNEVGFEMMIYSFGSGYDFETHNTTYLDQFKRDIAYANSKQIEVGGYDLICLDRGHGGYGGNVGDQWATVLADGSYGLDACFASGWYDVIKNITMTWVKDIGLSMVETDGPYGGEPCASENHSHHDGLEDSIYWQTKLQAEFYTELRNLNVFVNQPDNFFFLGGQKTGMGYNENQYSLPRWEDLTVSRMSMYDDTYVRTPTQGWMFVPLVPYHAGGDVAAFDTPLSANLVEYEWALAQYLGYGVAACYRGTRLYDTNETKQVVKKWVNFYKAHREILTSDIVHLRRPNMQGIDAIMHVNPFLEEKGLIMVFNPLSSDIVSDTLRVPIYYTGLAESASVNLVDSSGKIVSYEVDRNGNIHIDMSGMKALGIEWYVIKS